MLKPSTDTTAAGAPEAAPSRRVLAFAGRLGRGAMYWPALVITGLLAVLSLVVTCTFPPDYSERLSISIGPWLPILALGAGALGLMALCLHKGWWRRIPLKKLRIALYIFAAMVCVLWVFAVRSRPEADQRHLYLTASYFATGDYSAPARQELYFYLYPYQLGFPFVMELIFRVVGPFNSYFMQMLNVGCILLSIWALLALGRLMFNDARVDLVLTLLAFGFLPLYFYATFVYGTLPGLMFGLLALLHALRWHQNGKKRSLVWVALCGGLSVICKSSYLVLVIAIACYLLVELVRRPRVWTGLGLAGLLVCGLLGTQPIERLFEARTGLPTDEGVPTVMWIAMGLQDGAIGPGWYNFFTRETFEGTGYNAEATAEIGREAIRERLAEFGASPAVAVDFFSVRPLPSGASPPTPACG